MTPVSEIGTEHPEQLKQALANYRVANGYQLWYARNDWRSLLVYCGRSVECGRCIGLKSTKSGGKSAKSAGKSVKSGTKKKVSFSQPIQTRSKKIGRDVAMLGKGSSKIQPSKSPQTSPKTPQTLPKWKKKKIMDAKKSIPVEEENQMFNMLQQEVGGRGSRGRGRGTMGAESGGRGTMGAKSGGRGPMDAESGGRVQWVLRVDGRGGMGSGIGAIVLIVVAEEEEEVVAGKKCGGARS
ncbi:hypothetical protein Tco_1033013 [Tanacetum coccineum]|uniref:Uncharacterized protein n=1 Tax=Tanacetum coccineum TaxID=301880 RepID=A0ABQ5GDG0_9ASTR